MAPPNMFLFVNKDSNSPSLSRNTGREAAIASKINKHVQQQRFRKNSVSRKNWYRPFARSESSSPGSTASSTTTSLDFEEYSTPKTISQKSPKRSKSSSKEITKIIRRPKAHVETPRSVPRAASSESDVITDPDLIRITPFPQNNVFSRPGDSIDPFHNTIQPITPALRDVLARHLHWAVSSSISAFTIHEGVRRILSTIMTDRMHSAAFLAMATAQQRRTANMTLPQNEGAEFYRYKATKLIREHIIANGDAMDPYTFVDVFRLAMCEWLNGNHIAARVHFSYIAQVWRDFRPSDWGEQHNLEVISSEDIFLAIDIDEKPLLELNWESQLEASPAPPNRFLENVKCKQEDELHLHEVCDIHATSKLRQILSKDSPINDIIFGCLTSLCSIPDFSTADFASTLKGPLWVIKRRMNATMHRLQTLSEAQLSSAEDLLRRAFIVLLFLSTTTPARRLARTNFSRLASRLQLTMLKACNDKSNASTASPGFWLWVSVSGLVAVQEAMSSQYQRIESEELRCWFVARCTQFATYMFGQNATVEAVRRVLTTYAYFESVQGTAIVNILAAMEPKKRLSC